jgi:putative toxin-antitoxin system antitoxin component (TIGR02293 family)
MGLARGSFALASRFNISAILEYMSTSVRELLGGEEVFGEFVESNLDLAKATREGLPSAAAIELAREILEVDRRLFLGAGVPLRGFLGWLGKFGLLIGSLTATREANARLTPVESDLVVRTASALSKAIDVLGEKGKAVHWLKSPNQAFGGQSPLSLLDTSAGEHEVEALLDRIEYGVYS